MAARFLHSPVSPSHSHLTATRRLPTTASLAHLHLLRATGGDDNSATDTSGKLVNGSAADNAAVPTSSPRPSTLNIKYRPRSQRRREELKRGGGGSRKPSQPKREWEEMSLGEKAAELYVGEKGLLFWLNKLAYASIFIIAGGWILFRFVGPSLGLYQLDSSPLPPSAMFKGSS